MADKPSGIEALERSARFRADNIVMWASLCVYFLVWLLLPLKLMGEEMWPLILPFALVYTFAHLVTNLNGHCYLESDVTGLPLVAMGVGVFSLFNYFFHWLDSLMELVGALGGALLFGHIVALLFSAIFSTFLYNIFVNGGSDNAASSHGNEGDDSGSNKHGAD